jgi:hypothetical protein
MNIIDQNDLFVEQKNWKGCYLLFFRNKFETLYSEILAQIVNN